MSDIIDDASLAEAAIRAGQIAHARVDLHYPPPDIIHGVACCVECGEPIPAARLAAVPGCGLCVACADEWTG